MATDIDSPKRRRRRSNPENEDGPLSGEKNSVNASFQDAEDFVPFAPDSDEEEEDRPPVREWDKGKGRERDRDRDGDGDGERRRDRDRDKDRDGDFGRKRERERYGDDGYVNKKQRLDAASRKAPWVADIDWDSCNNVAEMLQRDVEAFIDYISPTPAEDEIRGLIVQLISRAVTQAFPDAQVLPFGSYETKLYLPLGDIDLVIQSPSMAYSDKVTVLHALANTMRRAGITDRVTIVAKAKVPIIKFITTHGRFAVDISLNQTNGVAAGKMINRYLRELPALRGLVMITKAFLSQRSMNEVYTGGLGSYSIVCLAISFLQMHPKIRRGEIDPSKNLGVLVMEFFELYGCYFNYEEVGISLRDGGTYFNKAARGWQDYRQLGLLSIEDPSDPTNDISRGSFGIARVRQTLAGAHGIMKAAAFQQAGSISAKREGRYFRFRDVDREEPSILAHVMGVTQETINHRRLVQEVYDKRILHRMLGAVPAVHANGSSKNGSRDRADGEGNDREEDEDDGSKPSLLSRLSGTERKHERNAVEEAWDVPSDPESPSTSKRKRSRKRSRTATSSSRPKERMSKDSDEEEESRYKVSKAPPRKRRRMGDARDAVFVPDEEEEDERSANEDSEEEEGEADLHEYDVDDSDGGGDNAAHQTRKKGTTGKNRSYWLSKGIGLRDHEDDY